MRSETRAKLICCISKFKNHKINRLSNNSRIIISSHYRKEPKSWKFFGIQNKEYIYKSVSKGSATMESQEAYIKKCKEDSKEKKALKKFFYCPACQGRLGSSLNLYKHIKKCCPDLLIHQNIDTPSELIFSFNGLRERERQLRDLIIYLQFNEPRLLRLSEKRRIHDLSKKMQLPLSRVEQILCMALKDVPLALDDERIDILYEDEEIIAVSKPPFITTSPKHRFEGGSLLNRVYGYLGKEPYGIHRLDMNTSGVVLFAKNSGAADEINGEFRKKDISKTYLALCAGIPKQTQYCVEASIDRDPKHEIARCISDNGKWSITEFEVLSSAKDHEIDVMCDGWKLVKNNVTNGLSLIQCMPKTGRTHQIRLHLQYSGNPIIGDEIYGFESCLIDRQALHAYSICFMHPKLKKRMCITAPLPEDFTCALKKVNLYNPLK